MAADLILASASPRRRNLLDLLGLCYHIEPADIEEVRRPGEDPADFARRAAREKAELVALNHTLPVLAADTVVALDGDALGKPADGAEAAQMLRSLSGRDHLVHTGVALARSGRCESIVDTATVTFGAVDEDMIRWYIQTGEPLDKAGAYAVQGAASLFITAVSGSPQTVIGLPLHRLPGLFAALDLDLKSMCAPTPLAGR